MSFTSCLFQLWELWLAFRVVVRGDGAETLLIFQRGTESANHRSLFFESSQRRTIDLSQPENKAGDVRVPAQVAKVLRQDKGPIVFGIDQGPIVDRVRLVVVG